MRRQFLEIRPRTVELRGGGRETSNSIFGKVCGSSGKRRHRISFKTFDIERHVLSILE